MNLPALNRGQRLALLVILTLIAAAAAWGVARFVSPSPPRTLTLSTGTADGAYHQFGLKYQAILKENGVTLVLQPSSGSVENLRRLGDGSASVGFVQGGLGLLALDPLKDASDTHLRSLATVAFEPVWIFSRKIDLSNGLSALAGKRIAVGAADSGNYKVATGLLATYGVLDAKGEPVATPSGTPPWPIVRRHTADPGGWHGGGGEVAGRAGRRGHPGGGTAGAGGCAPPARHHG